MDVVAGADIGGTLTKYGLVTSAGEVIAYDEMETDTAGTSPEQFFEKLYTAFNEMLTSASGYDESSLLGIGFGAPNANFFNGTIENAPNLAWKGVVPVVQILKRHTDLPVLLTNDANAAAIGEMQFGSAKGMRDFIAVTLGTGLGSGFVANGQLIYGHDGFAGELGHTIVEYDGRLCGCGRRGCLETYASATGIVRTVKEWLETTGEESVLRKSADKLDARQIAEAAREGDKLARIAFDFTGEMLGKKLADTVAITSPEAIILTGGLARAGDLIFRPTKKYMEAYMLNIFKNKVKLLPSGLPEANTAVLGAAALVRSHLKNET